LTIRSTHTICDWLFSYTLHICTFYDVCLVRSDIKLATSMPGNRRKLNIL